MSADPELLSKLKFFMAKPDKREPLDEQFLTFYINLTDDWWQVERDYISNGLMRIVTYHEWNSSERKSPRLKDVVEIKDFAGWAMTRCGDIARIISSFDYWEFGSKYEAMLKVFNVKMPFGKWRTGVSKYETPLIIHDVKKSPDPPFEVSLYFGKITTKGVAHSNMRTHLPVTDKMYLASNGVLVAPLQPIIDAIRNNVNKFVDPLAFKGIPNYKQKYMNLKWYKKPKPVKEGSNG